MPSVLTSQDSQDISPGSFQFQVIQVIRAWPMLISCPISTSHLHTLKLTATSPKDIYGTAAPLMVSEKRWGAERMSSGH